MPEGWWTSTAVDTASGLSQGFTDVQVVLSVDRDAVIVDSRLTLEIDVDSTTDTDGVFMVVWTPDVQIAPQAEHVPVSMPGHTVWELDGALFDCTTVGDRCETTITLDFDFDGPTVWTMNAMLSAEGQDMPANADWAVDLALL